MTHFFELSQEEIEAYATPHGAKSNEGYESKKNRNKKELLN